jgi:hypothetical protein
MHGPAASALTALLFGLSGLLLFASASAWAKLGRDREAPGQRPAIPVRAFRFAAAITAAAFVMLALASCWLALSSI